MNGCRGVLLAVALLLAAVVASAQAPSPELQSIVDQLWLERASALATSERRADEREIALLTELAANDRRLRAERVTRRAVEVELKRITEERRQLIENIASRDRQYSAEIAEYRRQVMSIANSPDPRKRAALAAYAEGRRAESFNALVEIQKAETKAIGAGWRELAALGEDRADHGEMPVTEVIALYEQAQRLDDDHAFGWLKLAYMYTSAGRPDDARRAAESAVENAKSGLERALALNSLSRFWIDVGDGRRAVQLMTESVAILRKLTMAEPGDADTLTYLADALEMLINDQNLFGSRPDPLKDLQEIVGIRQQAADMASSGNAASARLVDSRQHLAAWLSENGGFAQAIRLMQENVDLARRDLRGDPTSLELQGNVASALEAAADMLRRGGSLGRALDNHREAISLRRHLKDAQPSSLRYQLEYVIAANFVGQALAESGDSAGGRAFLEESAAIQRGLTAQAPTSRFHRKLLGMILYGLGDVLEDTWQFERARSIYEESVGLQRGLLGEEPSNLTSKRDVAVSLAGVARVMLASGDPAGARLRYEEVVKIFGELAAAREGDSRAQRDLSGSLIGLGRVLMASGGHGEARSRFDRAVAIRERVAAANPGNVELQRELGIALQSVGDAALSLGAAVDAQASYARSLVIFRKNEQGNESSAEAKEDLGGGLERMGHSYAAMGSINDAKRFYEENLALRVRLSAARPDDVEGQVALVRAHVWLGVLPDGGSHLESALSVAEALDRRGLLTGPAGGLVEAVRKAMSMVPSAAR